VKGFFIVGPTATGKSELAAEVAQKIDAEIVSTDAFQIYEGLNLLTAKPDAAPLAKAAHHLIGTVSLREEMNAEKFRRAAVRVIGDIKARGKLALVVGGSGLYIKALTHGLSELPEADIPLRERLNALGIDELRAQLSKLDPEAAGEIDMKNRRRVVRALEICLLSGKPVSAQRKHGGVVAAAVPSGSSDNPQSISAAETRHGGQASAATSGVFVFCERHELYERINRRVEAMFEKGVIEEVRALRAISSTAAQTIGLGEIQKLLDGKISQAQCVAAIQQATRRYAKRQLTWFRRQTNFEPLNLSLLSHDEAVEWISRRALSFAQRDD
jgi:tRNA dimethylallyltransferase